jgi:hypothetical protein
MLIPPFHPAFVGAELSLLSASGYLYWFTTAGTNPVLHIDLIFFRFVPLVKALDCILRQPHQLTDFLISKSVSFVG